MTAADVERLEHERLTGMPPQPTVTDLMRELIAALHQLYLTPPDVSDE